MFGSYHYCLVFLSAQLSCLWGQVCSVGSERIFILGNHYHSKIRYEIAYFWKSE